MTWILTNFINILLVAFIALIVGLLIRSMIRDKKAGKSSCGACAGCSTCGGCGTGSAGRVSDTARRS